MRETKWEYWSKLIAERQASEQAVRPFCTERGITEPSFYYWRKRLREKRAVRFVRLETKAASIGIAPALELVLSSGERLRMQSAIIDGIEL